MTDPVASPNKERLQKILARAGYGSRRACEELIVGGRVAVNGSTVSILGAQADPNSDRITVDGERVKFEKPNYWILNKPAGVAFTDETMSKVVEDYIPGETARLFTVGRLDRASSGLILLTNDGRVANLLTHPRYKVPRVYNVEVEGEVTNQDTALIERALFYAMNGGKFERISILKPGKRTSTLRLTSYEGLPDSLRDIFLKFDHPVQVMDRVGIGPLEFTDVAPGQARKLKHHELEKLMEYAVKAEKMELEYQGDVVSAEKFGKLARTPDFHRKGKGHRGKSPGGQKRFAARVQEEGNTRESSPRFGGERKPRFGGDRPRFGGDRPRFGAGRPPRADGERPRFDRDRPPRADGERPRFDRKPRFGADRGPRPGGDRPRFGGDRPRFDRPPRPDGERPRFERDRHPRADGERPRFDRKPRFGGDRPQFGDRKPRFGGDRPRFDRDRPPRADGERPRFDRKPRFGGDRPQFGDRKPRFGGDRPPRADGERPRFDRKPRFGGDRGPRPGGDRPRFGGDRKPRFGGDRPPRPFTPRRPRPDEG